MTRYEYLCKDCGSVFERQRPMSEAEGVVQCPAGHAQVRRRFSVFASGGAASSREPGAAPQGGGCCGGACGCR